MTSGTTLTSTSLIIGGKTDPGEAGGFYNTYKDEEAW